MKKETNKELLMILILTVVFGIGAFFLARQVDKNVSEITEIRHEIDELTRVAVDQDARVKELQDVEYYLQVLDEDLPEVTELIDILGQYELIGRLTDNDVTIKLEEGIVGSGEIQFEDEKEKNDFLNNLDVKEYTTSETDTSTTSDPSGNVVLQMMQEAEEEDTGNLKINYVEVDLNLKGSYKALREYIVLMQSSKYIMNIKEIRIHKTDDGIIETNLLVRAFIFEQS